MNIDPQVFSALITAQERAEFHQKFIDKDSPFKIAKILWITGLLLGVAVALTVGRFFVEDSLLIQYGIWCMIFFILSLILFFSQIANARKRIAIAIKSYRASQSLGLRYQAYVKNPTGNSLIFSDPLSNFRILYDHMQSTAGRDFELGNYYEGESSSQREIGYMRIRLDTHIPHLVLDATFDDNSFFGYREQDFDRTQILKLEGNFNEYFTLYAPKKYETDALYVFTPDLMALFIDEAAMFNAEIVDNDLYIFSNKPFELDKPEIYQRLTSILETVGKKALKQTKNYQDTRSEIRNTIATSGSRLKRRNEPLMLVSIVVMVCVTFIFLLANPELVGALLNLKK